MSDDEACSDLAGWWMAVDDSLALAKMRYHEWSNWARNRHGDSSQSLTSPYHINTGIPRNGDTEGNNEGRRGPQGHCRKMQYQQRSAESA
jgi:hypothetical protein